MGNLLHENYFKSDTSFFLSVCICVSSVSSVEKFSYLGYLWIIDYYLCLSVLSVDKFFLSVSICVICG